MGHHGWKGNPPPTEEDARRRIVTAAAACIEQFGAAKTTLSDVATELGVTRQTVYRYYANLGELFGAVAQDRVEEFVQRMAAHLADFSTPADVAIESVVWAVRTIPHERFIGALLRAGETDAFSRGVTSSLALSLGGGILRDARVDWSAAGVADAELESLAEMLMRLLISFLHYPADPPRSEEELRALVARWLGPALATRQLRPRRNTRPRDALGRPLPYGAVGVGGQPEGVSRTASESLIEAYRLLDEGRPFHAHEVLEDAWKSQPEDERELWRGLAQLAVGVTHAARGNAVGGRRLIERGAGNLGPYVSARPYGLDLAAVIRWSDQAIAEITRGTPVALKPPPLLPLPAATAPERRRRVVR